MRFSSPIQAPRMDEKHTLTGNIQQHAHFESRILRNRRDVLVYLPPSYRRSPRRRYPVLYLHDGQNIFDAATSFAGVEWGADESAQRLTAAAADRADHHRGDREHGRGSHPRICADPGRDRSQRETQAAQPGAARAIRPFFERGIETVHRSQIPDATGSGIYRARRLVVRRAGHARSRALVSAIFQSARGHVALRSGGTTARSTASSRRWKKSRRSRSGSIPARASGAGNGHAFARSAGREGLAAL